MAYKKDQGRLTRMAAFWSLAILAFYGCVSLYQEMVARSEALTRPIGGIRIPVLGLDLSGALLISTVVFCGTAALLYRYLERPKLADLLIETENELRKVTWPTLQEAIQSSVVVLVVVAVLMGFLAGADFVLGRWANWILLGGG